MWEYTWIIENMNINWGWEVSNTNPQHQYSFIVLLRMHPKCYEPKKKKKIRMQKLKPTSLFLSNVIRRWRQWSPDSSE